MFNFGNAFGIQRTGAYKRQYGWEYPSLNMKEAYEEYLEFIDDELVLSHTPEEIASSFCDNIHMTTFVFSSQKISDKLEAMYGKAARNKFRQIIIDGMAAQNMSPILDWGENL